MKLWELAHGLMISLTNEEDELLNKMMEDDKVVLSEREEVVAQHLTQKSVFIREETDEKYIFTVNYRIDTWRD